MRNLIVNSLNRLGLGKTVGGAVSELKHSRHMKKLAIGLALAAVISAIATYLTIAHSSGPFGPDPEKVLPLILVSLIFLLALAAIVSWKVFELVSARRRGSVGSRLQTRIIIIFSMISIAPTIVIAVFSFILFDRGIQSWFDDRVSTALEESVAVADGYLQEHKENIRADILAMANDLNMQSLALTNNPARFKQTVKAQAALRSLTEAVVFRRSQILAKTDLTFSLLFEMDKLPEDALDRAAKGEVVVLTNQADDRVRALIKLNGFFDTYLLVGRFVDSKVLSHIDMTKSSVDEYQRLKANISRQQIQFSFVFLGVALLFLLAAIWLGISFADHLVTPVSELVAATDKVKSGDLGIRVQEGPENDEIGTLGRAFNRMTGQLQKQRDDLVKVSWQIDERRRFIEAVLSGVSAGVIATDSDKNISLFNPSATGLLAIEPAALHNKKLVDVIPEVAPLLEKAENSDELLLQDEVVIARDNRKSSFLVRIVKEEFSDEIEGYIVTFDDITELLNAQRSAAWSDVARRIAHEIKNPLTPIHLSVERIRQKYGEQIGQDRETFEKYINTITRHLGNVGQIVEEFSNFARMPSPVMKKANICEIIRETVLGQQEVDRSIKYNLQLPDSPVYINGDRGQITQILVNLVKNSIEAIGDRPEEIVQKTKGEISISVDEEKYVTVEIIDNGCGFPDDLLDRITEPYVTTKEKGTGLGLAIVKKVMGDHEGTLLLENITDSGGNITGSKTILSFPTYL